MKHILVALLLCSAPVHAADLVGRATVIDGDTIDVASTRIRLHGVDAPESSQLCANAAGVAYRCGQAAALALADKLGSAPTRCRPRQRDVYGRTIAVCTQDGASVNAWLVREGHAVAMVRYSRAYVHLERSARAARKGMWQGSAQDPSMYRRCMKALGARATTCSVSP